MGFDKTREQLCTFEEKLKELGLIDSQGHTYFKCDNWEFFRAQLIDKSLSGWVVSTGLDGDLKGRVYALCGGRLLLSWKVYAEYHSTKGRYFSLAVGVGVSLERPDAQHNEFLSLVCLG